MENNEKRKKVCQNLLAEIEKLKEELKKLQEDCPHKEKILKFEENNSVYKFCKSCKKNLGLPNEKELRDNRYL